MQEDMLTIKAAATLAGVSPQRIRQLVKAGRIQAVPTTAAQTYVSRAAVEAWASGPRKPVRPRKPVQELSARQQYRRRKAENST